MSRAALDSTPEISVADFAGANLTGAQLRFNRTVYRASFAGADLTDARLICGGTCFNVDFSDAKLGGADLSASMRVESWRGACYSSTTRLPFPVEEAEGLGLVPCP